jgi:hypothetical protein
MATKTHRKTEEAPPSEDGIRIRGFFRVHIEDGETGEVIGDSGWCENMITNTGFQYYLCGPMAGLAGSSSVNFVALGTGTTTNSNDTALAGEITGGTKGTAPTAAGSATNRSGVQWTATFNSTSSFLTTTSTLNNVGLFGHSSSNSLCAGSTYASSTCGTAQNVNVSYVISYS